MPPQTCQKLVFRHGTAELVEVPRPEAGPDQVLIQTRCSLISPGTERAALTEIWDDAGFRENPGYALAGDVVDVGRDGNGFQPGDRVITLLNHASWVAAPTDPWVTLKIPPGVSYEAATFVPLASVALHAIRRARIEFGEYMVIFGAGIIGLIATQLAKMNGARSVIVLDLARNRLDLARRCGADLALDPTDPGTNEAIRAATDGHGPSVVLEATGNTRVIPEAFKITAFGGRVVCVGVMEEAIPISLHRDFIQRELSLIAAFQPFCPTTDTIYWHWTQQANRTLLLNMLAAGHLHIDTLLTDRVPAGRAPGIYERIRQGDRAMLGVLLEWRPQS